MDQPDDTKPQEGVVEELPDTSKYKGRHPRAVAEKIKAAKPEKPPREIIQERIQQELVGNFVQQFVLHEGNATEAVLALYPNKERGAARDMGYKLQKLAGPILVQHYMQTKGRGYNKMLDVAWEKMLDSKTPEWWDRIMKMMGYEDFLAKEAKSGGQTVNILNVQKDIMKEYTEGEVIDAE